MVKYIADTSQAQNQSRQPKLNTNQILTPSLGWLISGLININFNFLAFLKGSWGLDVLREKEAKPGISTFPPILIPYLRGAILEEAFGYHQTRAWHLRQILLKANSGFGRVARARSADNRKAGFVVVSLAI